MFLLVSYTQLLRIMRLTAVLLLIGFLHVSAGGFGQNVTLSLHDVPVSTVLQEIIKQTHISIVYDKSEVNKSGPISIEANNQPVEEVLNRCFKDQPFSYQLINNTIVVKAKPIAAVSPLKDSPPPPSDVHGRVTDSLGNPLAGASIYIKGTKRGTITDANGYFTLKNVSENQTLIISFTGYVKKEYKIETGSDYKISLVKSNNQLDQVVVIPYGTTTQRLNTGDVSTITSKTIEEQPVSNVLAALEGRVPGLIITQTTGVPGGGFNVQIRGQNSISNGNDPFYVIDGVPYNSQMPGGLLNGSLHGGSPLNFINPYDIDRIEVLKDADATAIYGSRAANGAILITTKKGKAGAMKLDLNLYSGVTNPTRDIQMLNTEQYLSMRHEAFNNDGAVPNPNRDFDLTFWDTTRYTNWSKTLTQNRATYTDAEASVSGGNNDVQYLIGAGYYRQTTGFPTLIPGDGADQKGSVHFNVSTASQNKKFKLSLTGNYVADKNSVQSEDFSRDRLTLSPDAPAIFNQDGSLNWAPLTPGSTGTWTNPYSNLYVKYLGSTSSLVANATASYMILPSLEFKASMGYTNGLTNEVNTFPTTIYDPGLKRSSGSSSFNTLHNNSWIIEPQINYNLNISKGKLSILVGTTFLDNYTETQRLNASGFTSDALLENIQAAGKISAGSNSSEYKYNAGFSRINYNWQDKYLINFTARRDGSSRFGPGKQFANFGALGVGWIFSQESFVKNNLSYLSFGKLRASYGTTGNDQIGNYQFLDLYNSTDYPYQSISGLYPVTLYNPDLAWEVNKKMEVGIELGFIKDKILFQASYYRNRSGNQLVTSPVSLVTGYSSIPANLPALVQNSGVEFVLNTVNIRTKNFTWTTSFNLSIARNKLISFPNLANSPYANSLVVGKPITIIKAYHMIGVNDTTGIYQFSDFKNTPTYSPSNTTDLKVLIDKTPQYYGGFDNTFSYKGVSLDIFFQFVKQVGENIFGSYTIMPGVKDNIPVTFLNHWQKPGDKKSFQMLSQNFGSNAYQALGYAQQSDFAYSDASFIRLKNVSLSWELAQGWNNKYIKSCKVFIQGQNLLTITHFMGIDPESQGNGLPPLRVWTAGFHLTL